MSRQFEPDVLAHYVGAVLAPNGRYGRIRSLLTSIDYLAAKVTGLGPEALVADIRAAQRLAPSAEAAGELLAIETAVVEAARILRADPAQFRSQLLARVPRAVADDMDTLLDDAAVWSGTTWLRPSGQMVNYGHRASFGPVRGAVAALAVSDDGSVLIAGDRVGSLQAWDMLTRDRLWEQEVGAAVTALAFRPGSYEAFAALGDGTVGRWSLADRRLRPLTATGLAASSLAAGDGILVSGSGTAVYGYHLGHAGSGPRPGSRARDWEGSEPAGQVTAVAVLDDGERAVSGSADGSVCVWRTTDGELLDRIRLGTDRVLCAAAVPGSACAAFGTRDRLVLVVNIDTGGVATLRGHSNQVRSVAGLADGRVVSGSYDGQVLVWDLAGRGSNRAGSHSTWCLSVAAPRRGGPVISASSDGMIRVWDPDGTAAEAPHGQDVRALAADAGVAYACVDLKVRRFDLNTGGPLPPLTGHRRPAVALAVAPRGVVSSSYDGTIRLWDRVTGKSVILKGHTRGVDAIAVTPDGREIVSVARDATWRRWDAETGQAGPAGYGSGPFSSVLALSPDGETLATANADHVIEIWHRRSGRRLLPPLQGHAGYVERLAITPGGRLLSGSWDRTVRAWSLATGDTLSVLRYPGWVQDLVLTSDGRRAITACEDGSITVIDTDSLQITDIFEAHRGGLDRLALSADDGTLFSIGSGQVRAWDTRDWTQLAVFDADLPLREIAMAGRDLVVVGTSAGRVIALSLERRAMDE